MSKVLDEVLAANQSYMASFGNMGQLNIPLRFCQLGEILLEHG